MSLKRPMTEDDEAGRWEYPELVVSYHCAGLGVLACASGQDRWLYAGHRLTVTLLQSNREKREVIHAQTLKQENQPQND